MKTITLLSTALLAVAVSSSPALAQNVTTAAPAANASMEAPAVDHVVYLARLPTPGELMQGAEAQHAKIDRMDQSGDRIVAVYSYANGRSVTFAYTLLSAIATQPNVTFTAAPAPAQVQTVALAPSSVTYVSSQPAPTVVYTSPQTVYYAPGYTYTRYYDPAWDFFAPLAIGVGLGWGWHGGGWHGGGWHGGGWHGGHGGHGGWHR
jgi:hypothetical protein